MSGPAALGIRRVEARMRAEATGPKFNGGQPMDLDLRGKVALVTGGTSGIGRAISVALLDERCEVHVADINLSAAQDAPEFAAANARLTCMDVGDARGVQHAVDAIVAERGR